MMPQGRICLVVILSFIGLSLAQNLTNYKDHYYRESSYNISSYLSSDINSNSYGGRNSYKDCRYDREILNLGSDLGLLLLRHKVQPSLLLKSLFKHLLPGYVSSYDLYVIGDILGILHIKIIV